MEEWRKVTGYEEHYEVSSIGRIRSIKKGRKRILKFAKDKDGYFVVSLCINGTMIQKRVAAMVLESFVGPRPEGLLCCHKNGDNQDNSTGNLYWGTYVQNNRDTVVHGTRKGPEGETHHLAKLTDCDVKEILLLRSQGWSQNRIASKFNITQSNVSRIVNRKSRKKVKV